ncbi:MAG: L,D-transpeptidase [Gammaproteobacteria bacterium]|nr:L,D-transpeptidase [Gammaproteobacteria bacterium]
MSAGVKSGTFQKSYRISSAKNGLGETEGSYCTPRGWHSVAEIIGKEAPIYSVFKGRLPTGQIYTPDLAHEGLDNDWILSRIIRLKGCERGFNLGGHVDSYSRYIYIHGCAAEDLLGQPASQGCIRMGNQAVIALARFIRVGDTVFID